MEIVEQIQNKLKQSNINIPHTYIYNQSTFLNGEVFTNVAELVVDCGGSSFCNIHNHGRGITCCDAIKTIIQQIANEINKNDSDFNGKQMTIEYCENDKIVIAYRGELIIKLIDINWHGI